MPPLTDFYTFLSTIFQQITQTPYITPLVLPEYIPTNSQEEILLKELQTTLAVLQAQQVKSEQQRDVYLHEQSVLLEISQTLASALVFRPDLILDQLRMIVAYKQAVFFALKESRLVALAVRGPQPLVEAMPFDIQLDKPESLSILFNNLQLQKFGNVWCNNSPETQFLQTLLEEQAAVLLEGVQTWLWIPLTVKGLVIGGIGLAHSEPDSFSTHHINLARIVAHQATITLANAQLYKQAQVAATLQERQRLAQSLHDAVNQSLFSAGLIAEVLPRLWKKNPDEGWQSLNDLRRLIRGAMAEMRGLLVELQPLVLTDSKLGDLLNQLADAFTGRTNIPVIVTIMEEGLLSAEVQIAFYRICQEGLNNIAKHAQAAQVIINLRYLPHFVELQLQDNGCGFDLLEIPVGHYGLTIMRERATAIGATLVIASHPGQGSKITLQWLKPLPQETL